MTRLKQAGVNEVLLNPVFDKEIQMERLCEDVLPASIEIAQQTNSTSQIIPLLNSSTLTSLREEHPWQFHKQT